MSISSSFLPSPSRFFSKKSRRSRRLTVDTPSSPSAISSPPQLPLHAPPDLDPPAKSSLASSLPFISLRHRASQTPVTKSFLPFGSDVFDISTETPSYDKEQKENIPGDQTSRVLENRSWADPASPLRHLTPTADALPCSYFPIREDTALEASYTYKDKPDPYSLYPTGKQSKWSNAEEETEYDTELEDPLNAVQILESFFEEDQPSPVESEELRYRASSAALRANADSPRPRRAAFSLASALTSPSALTSIPSNMATRLRRNSSRIRRPKRLANVAIDSCVGPHTLSAINPRLSIDQSSLPPSPLSARNRRTSATWECIEPALESPIHLQPPHYRRRTISSQQTTPDSQHFRREERRVSVASSAISHSVSSHIIPPEELTKIAPRRRGSISSVSSTASVPSLPPKVPRPDQDNTASLPRSPFIAPVGLTPPPRPRASMQTTRVAGGLLKAPRYE